VATSTSEILAIVSQALEAVQGSASDSEATDSIGKNVVNSSLYGVKGKVKPSLTSPEKTRVKNTTDVIVERWFKIKSKYDKDTKPETVVSKSQRDGQDAADMAKNLKGEGKKAGKGLLGWLSSLLGTLGFFGGAKKGIFKAIGGWLWRSIKWMGGKLWGFIKWALGKGWDLLKGMFKKAWAGIKAVGRGAWNMVKSGIRGVGRFFSKLWTGFKELPIWKKFGEMLTKGKEAAKALFNSVKDRVVGALKAVGTFFKNAISKIPGIGKLFPTLAKSSVAAATAGATAATRPPRPAPAPRPQQAAKGPWWKRAASFVGQKASQVGGAIKGGATAVGGAIKGGATAVGGAIKGGATAAWSGVKAAGSYIGKGSAWMKDKALTPAKNAISKYAGGMVKRAGGILGILKKFAKIPVIGPIIEGFFMKGDLQKLQKRYEAGEITEDELRQQAGKRAVKGVTAMAGAAIGAIGGSLIPIPVVGTLIGAIGGDLLGRFIGGLISDHVLKPKWVQDIGGFALGALTKKKPASEMQDFIMQRGTVMPFSSKDELLGMKAGGAISQLLDDSFLSPDEKFSGKLAALQVSAIEISNKYLHQLVQLTELLVKKPAGGGTRALPMPRQDNSIPGTQGSPDGPSFADSRVEFYNSPYSMHTPGSLT